MQTGGHKIVTVISNGRYKSAYLKYKKKKTGQTNKKPAKYALG